MLGADVIKALRKKLRTKTDRELSLKLGITSTATYKWERRAGVTPRQIAGIVASAREAAKMELQDSAIRPIVEFFPIEKSLSKGRVKYRVFDVLDHDGEKHPYVDGLRNELMRHHGVYIFFDSRGRAIYAGKARKQSLWKEINQAFNRGRGELQEIKRVKHPSRRQRYRTTEEKARQIRPQPVPLFELAKYVSAYQVTDGMINELEAMLVRSFANDLLNSRMERFIQQRRTKR